MIFLKLFSRFFISYGGGTMPLFNDAAHRDMNRYLKSLSATLP